MTKKLTFGSLFAGIGGFDLGLERAGMECRWQVEIDPFCQKVLQKHWPNVKKYGDIKDVKSNDLEPVDVICGGFPCQPYSKAGKQRGENDDRALWKSMFQIIEEKMPDWIIGENVDGIIDMALEGVLADLASENYQAQAFIIPAVSLNASHRRDRVWIIAHSNGNGYKQREQNNSKKYHFKGLSKVTPHSNGVRLQIRQREKNSSSWENLENGPFGLSLDRTWAEISAAQGDRGDDGIPGGVDRRRRVKALGNSVVPQIPEIIGKYILKVEEIYN